MEATPGTHYRVFFNIWPAVPVYHRPVHGPMPFRTVCKREIRSYRDMIPTKHARKFGRPCKDCFPGGQDV